MKKLISLRLAALLMIPILTVSCSSARQGTRRHTYFNEGASANVVLHFYEWNSIYVTRPDTREDKFLPLLNRETVAQVLTKAGVGHDVAVVIVSHFYTKEQEVDLARDWDAFLADKGFRRVVLLRAGSSNIEDVNGLMVMHDSAGLASSWQPSAAQDVAKFSLPATK